MKKLIVLSLFAAGSQLVACNKETPAAAPPAPIVVVPAKPVVEVPAAEVKLAPLTPAEVETRRKEQNFFVFDNNTKDRFDKGHVPGAKWVDPSALTAADLPTDKTATLVFYCANTECSACHVGAETAMKLGYKNVFIMPEGIAGWEGAKLPVETRKG